MSEITPLSHWLSGEAAFFALKKAVDELTSRAPEDHDIIIEAFDLSVREVKYIEPHTLLFCGLDHQGNDSFVICHFSQLLARVVYMPKCGLERIITGFSQTKIQP